jgi:hypothetical protein
MGSGLHFARLRLTPCGKACPNVQVGARKSEHERTQARHFCLVCGVAFCKNKEPVPDSKLSCTRLDAVL